MTEKIKCEICGNDKKNELEIIEVGEIGNDERIIICKEGITCN